MKNLSITQQYLLCVLNKKGKLPTFGIERMLCVSAGSVLELLMEGIVVYDEKKLTVRSALPQDKAYLYSVYEVIEKKQPVKFESIVEYYSFTFTNKHVNELIEAIGDVLVQKESAQEKKGGVFGKKKLYIPNQADVNHVVQCIRAELLEDGEVSEETVALTILLNKSGDLKRYFSEYEKTDLKRRLNEIKTDPKNKLIEKVDVYLNALLCLLLVSVTGT